MLFPCLVRLRTIAFTATFLLIFQDVVASKQNTEDGRQLQECMEHEIARCYKYSTTTAFAWDKLLPNDNGEYNEEAYKESCRILNETSSCYEGSRRCPPPMANNFTRREEGYRAFRAIICDTEVFKDVKLVRASSGPTFVSGIYDLLDWLRALAVNVYATPAATRGAVWGSGLITARNCTIMDKMKECVHEQMSVSNETDVAHVEIYCRLLHAERVCYKKAWNSSCPMSLESAVATGNKGLDALELANDCKSMYPNIRSATEGTGSKAVTLSDLAADIAEIKAIVRENAQAIASLTDKVKENTEILKRQARSME